MHHLLIAGGTGFIGYHLCKMFKKKGWKVSSISINRPKGKRFVRGVKYISLDLTKKKLIKNRLQGDYSHIINASGFTTNLYSKKNKKRIFQSHFNGTKNLIDYFKNKNIEHFIQIGSSAEYGKAKSPLKESSHCLPSNHYGKAKLKASRYILKVTKKKNFSVNILRLFQVYGPNQGDNRVVMQILKACIKKKKFPTSDGNQIRDFCYIDDVTRAIESIFKKDISAKILNIGFGKGITIKKLIICIKKIARGGLPQYGLFNSRNHENPSLIPSIEKAKKVLGWKPIISLEKGLNLTKRSING
tara:strand:- start:1053 stop:1955 length:903 start_codon:yes stop_codon:yes gene_type:complete